MKVATQRQTWILAFDDMEILTQNIIKWLEVVKSSKNRYRRN